MKKCHIFWILLLCMTVTLYSQSIPPTPASTRTLGYETRQALEQSSILRHATPVSVGPTVFSGRVTDIEVDPDDPTHFYVAYASGGLWYTENNGTSFEPIFDSERVLTIGDIAVDWKNNRIYVGTGEVNSSRSSYAGDGVYRSDDGGKSWTHLGLEESHHIGKVLVHPENPEVLWVAALGHLYSSNPERGVYKSEDGGATWKQTLYIDDNTGAVDLVLDPQDPDIMYSAMWYRERRAWNFVESGATSGIYKSVDGGDTWVQSKKGFPQGEGVGRIGLAAGVDAGKTIVYAVLDNQERRPQEKSKKKEGLDKEDFRNMSREEFLKLDVSNIEDYLKKNRFPKKYKAEQIRKDIQSGSLEPLALTEYVEDANSLLFDTPVKGGELYRSDDDGGSWYKTHDGYLEGLFYSYGYYFAIVRVDPTDVNKIYLLGVPIIRSSDGGKTWDNINKENVHVDHHALWVNPNRKGHLIDGNDGGINISYDDGETWIKCNSLPVGQFYTVNVDLDEPYNIYGGLQDNGVWKGPSTYTYSLRWHNTGKYPYQELIGGDGMQIQIDNRGSDLVYTGYQFGNYFRIDAANNKYHRITPMHELGDRPYRWNWQSPILLSPHNNDIVYFGCNKLLRSMDKGNTFTEISPDLTKGGRKGDVAYGTLTSISESVHDFGHIYIGTDDGRLHVTRDGGISWEEIGLDLPQDLWVSRVVASIHKKGRVYVSLNGYRWDDFKAYVYRSDDYGKTWTSISSGLPAEPVNVIKEDLVQEDLLFVGTDHGAYFSMDRGDSYMRIGGMPHAPVHDVVVHPTAHDLVIATHGRSIFKYNLTPLRTIMDKGTDSKLVLLPISKKYYSTEYGKKPSVWRKTRIPTVDIPYYALNNGDAVLRVFAGNKRKIYEEEVELKKGMSSVDYDLSVQNAYLKTYSSYLKKEGKDYKDLKADNGVIYLRPDVYMIELLIGGTKVTQELIVE